MINHALIAHSENETRILSALTTAEQDELGGLMAKILAGLQSGS